jgi:hypothetical protein
MTQQSLRCLHELQQDVPAAFPLLLVLLVVVVTL